MKKPMPGRTARTFAFILALLLTLCLFLKVASTQVLRVLTDAPLHQRIATADPVLDAQMERINAVIDDVAARQSFQPETLKALVTRDALRDYNAACIAWWMSLLQETDVPDAPFWDEQALQDAVREDELFLQSVKSTLRRSVARDDVAYPVAQAIQEAVLPLRTQLISFAMPMVQEKVDLPAIMRLMDRVPTFLGLASLALALLILLTLRRCFSQGCMYVGASAAACALLTLGLMLAVYLLDPASILAQANALLALQCTLLLKELALPLLIASIAALLLGYVLIALHHRCLNRRIVRSINA